MPENHFGEAVAASYDDDSADMFQPSVIEPTVEFLATLAGDGAALELGIGTGRIALPLAHRGIKVHGIDLSEAMVARLRAKPGAEQINVAVGDFATTTVPGRFALAYLVFNTIENLTSQDEQVACFQNVAAHLAPGGCFVIEVEVPQLQRLPPGETVRAFALTPTHLGFDEFDVANQGGRRRRAPAPLDAVPLCLAGRAGPDGPAGRDDPAGALGRLAARAVHQREHQTRLGLGEAGA
jgi:SAM-dependent methyltransferase